MDLLDLVRRASDGDVGHKAVPDRLNLRQSLRQYACDPMAPCLAELDDQEARQFRGDIGRYAQAFAWYSLSLKRALTQCSVARQYESEVRPHPATWRDSPRQRAIAAKAKAAMPYLELDYHNLIIHACILMDRTVALSRRFLRGRALPSFTSFSKHKEFLGAHTHGLPEGQRQYARLIIETTPWFEVPLKVLRDNFLMHAAERHATYFGWCNGQDWDLTMTTIVGEHPRQTNPLGGKWITFSPRRLALDMEAFLTAFSICAQKSIKEVQQRP
jgi:hypothetical protein